MKNVFIKINGFSALLAVCLLVGFSGCGNTGSEKHSSESKDKNAKPVKKGVAIIKPTQGNNVRGKVTFTVVDKGVSIDADIEGLKPGYHGFHVHEFGDCSAPDGSSAGGHFNPSHKKHGAPDASERHAGDLGNIEADGNGVSHFHRVDQVVSLNGPESIIGKSVIIHADPDDFKTQPTGNSGGRVACGVIEVLE